MIMRSSARTVVASSAPLLLSALLFTIPICAQVAQASLSGTVTDPNGNRIPGAQVTAVQDDTGAVRKTLTNSQGTYLLDHLPAGIYSVSFGRNGFGDFLASRVDEVAGRIKTLDVQMTLARGAAEQTTVTEPFVQLDRSDAAVGTSIERVQSQELPLNGRNWASLTALTPGAVDTGANDQRTIRFAGHGLDDNNITLDGVDATAIYNQEQREYVRLTIPLQSITEMQSQSQNFGADMEGGTAGGQVAVATPSGTNSFHGDAFDFFRNDALDARSPFDGSSPDPFLLNQFGGNVGGPVIHDKTFST